MSSTNHPNFPEWVTVLTIRPDGTMHAQARDKFGHAREIKVRCDQQVTDLLLYVPETVEDAQDAAELDELDSRISKATDTLNALQDQRKKLRDQIMGEQLAEWEAPTGPTDFALPKRENS